MTDSNPFVLRIDELSPEELRALALDGMTKDAKANLQELNARLIVYGVEYALAEQAYRLDPQNKQLHATRERLSILFDVLKKLISSQQSILRIERDVNPF